MRFPKGKKRTVKGAVNILVSADHVEIDIHDEMSGGTFVHLELTPEQFCRALSREVHIECDVETAGLELVGRQQEIDHLEFPLPKKPTYNQQRDAVAAEVARQHCPKGWTPDLYFGSADSFFTRDGKPWARCAIRRWVKADEA